MSRIKFGNTWWGKEWLNALNNIYTNNRLPRGQRYARNGSVTALNLDIGQIAASVQGSMPKPYKIRITLPVFTEKQKDVILNTVTNDPYYLGQLLSAKLPHELNGALLNQKIYLFPESWSDFNASCSCPDYANPCKHLAAIIYTIANQIDLNPFTVLELRGLNLPDKINSLYGNANLVNKNMVKQFTQLKYDIPVDITLNSSIPDEINFALNLFVKEKIFKLLPNKPLFVLTTDYKAVLNKHYSDLSKLTSKFAISYDEDAINPNQFIIEPIIINPDLTCKIDIYDYNKLRKINSVESLFDFIQQIPNLSLTNNSKQINALYLIFHLTRTLLINGAIIPEIYKYGEHQYIIRYIPLLADEQVKQLVYQIAALVPTNLVFFRDRYEEINNLEQVLWLNAVFIKYLLNFTRLKSELVNFVETSRNYKSVNHAEEALVKVNKLFVSEPIIIDPATEIDLINHVSLWLARFAYSQNNVQPVIQIKEKEDKFYLELLIRHYPQSDILPLTVKEALSNSSIIHEVLKIINTITEYIPELSPNSAKNSIASFDEEPFLELFFNLLPILQLLGVNLLLPKSLKSLILPTLVRKVETTASTKNINYLNLEEMLTFDWQISLGKQNISVAEFKKLLNQGHQLVRLKNGYVYLEQAQIDKILADMDKTPKNVTKATLLKDILAGESQGTKLILSKKVQQIIEQFLLVTDVELPKQLLANLRDYQKIGYSWLYKNLSLGFGAIIADDMGLGKTLQVISCILKLKQDGLIKSGLIIVPTSLLTNWFKEMSRFSPSLSVNIYHGKGRDLINDTDITLITYGMIRRDIGKIKEKLWDLLVIDEAQNIKNVNTEQTKLIKSIPAKYKIAMSGTPVENRLSEYYSIMDFANRGYLGTISGFNKDFAKPIEVNRDTQALNKFLTITKPFVLRRLKTDKSIIHDLPDKVIIDEYCDLTKTQAALYQATLNSIMAKLKEESDEFARSGLVLNLIMALKQICNHPAQYLKQFDSIDIEQSGKLNLLFDRLGDIYATNEKVLIFTQFAEMGNILQTIIEKHFNTPVLFLSGGTTRKKRDEFVDLIQTNSSYKTMILSIKAGGVGLNLTQANHVIHYDLWWNPAVENQATDRAYRIGQNKNVFVHRLICSNSFEEKINQMIKDKAELANLTVATGENWIGKLSDKELHNIFDLEQ